MADSKNEHLIYAMVRFLEQELLKSDKSPDEKEALEVGIQCLENVYGLSTDLMVKYPLPASLPEIFEAGLKIKQAECKPKEISLEDKAQADKHKSDGNELMKQENFEGAIEQYSKAIELDDSNAVYFCNRAAAYSKLNDNTKALEDCLQALTIDPKYSKAYGRKGLAHSALSQFGDAKHSFEKALELDPNNESYKKNLEVAEQKLVEQGGGSAGQAGFPGMPGFGAGAGLGEMNFAQMLNNPAIINMATQMMSNPQMQEMMANMMGQFGGGGGGSEEGGPPPMEEILQAGQRFAQEISQQNPDLVNQLRQAGGAPPGNDPPPSEQDKEQS